MLQECKVIYRTLQSWIPVCEGMEILQNWKRQIHSLEQVSCSWPWRSSNAGMQCSKRKHKSWFCHVKPRRAEVAKTSQKHQDSTDEGTDDSSEESRDSTTKNIFFCSEEGCIKSYQRHSSLQKHLECGRHKYVLEYETLYDRVVLGYASRLEKGPSAVPELRDTKSTPSSSVASLEMGWALKQSRSRNTRFTDKKKGLLDSQVSNGRTNGLKINEVSERRKRRAATWLLWVSYKQAISSFFSRLASKRSLDH